MQAPVTLGLPAAEAAHRMLVVAGRRTQAALVWRHVAVAAVIAWLRASATTGLQAAAMARPVRTAATAE